MDSRVPGASIVLILLLMIIAAGCTSSTTIANTPVTTPALTTTPEPASAAATVTTLPATAVSTTTPVPALTTAVAFRKSDINQRFMDVAFGTENGFLNRWRDRYVKVSVMGDYTPEDVTTLNDFITIFNNASATSKLSRVMEGQNEDITIHIQPESFLKTMHDDETNRIYRDENTGEILFIDQTLRNQWEASDNLYVNSRFIGEERKYLLLRSFLYELGFEGYSGDPNSFFYLRARTGDIRSSDWIVIGMMYSKRFSYGDSFTVVKNNLTL
jgi:hypothetical protein